MMGCVFMDLDKFNFVFFRPLRAGLNWRGSKKDYDIRSQYENIHTSLRFAGCDFVTVWYVNFVKSGRILYPFCDK